MMTGIEIGATAMTLSSGERIRFERGGTPTDLLIRVGEASPYVRLKKTASGARLPQAMPAADQLAEQVAAALRADRGAAQQLSLASQLRLAAPLRLAVPAWWTPQVRTGFSEALAQRGVVASLVNGAEAAVAGYRGQERALPDAVVVLAVKHHYTSVAVVRDTHSAPRALMNHVAVLREGGAALDAAVLRRLVAGLESMGDRVERESPSTIVAAQAALTDCKALRESLSHVTSAAIRPNLPGATRSVLLVRSELDELAQPWIDEVIRMIRDTIAHHASDIGGVLLVGGLSAMPLISQRVSAELGVEVIVPDHTETLVATGAERSAAPASAPPRRWRSIWPFNEASRGKALVGR